MDGTTGIVLAVVFGLVTLVLGILNYIQKRNENETNKIISQNNCDNQKTIKQTEFDIKLANIEKELAEIKSLLVASNEKYGTLEKRVFILENSKSKRKES